MTDWRDFVMDRASGPYEDAARRWMLHRTGVEAARRAGLDNVRSQNVDMCSDPDSADSST